MYLTEEEAKKKWCPETRLILVSENVPTAPAHNRVTLDGETFKAEGGNCIASECMKWWWDSAGRKEPLKVDGKETSFEVLVIDENTRGYCGQGGKP